MRSRVAHRSRPCAGEIANGDRALARPLDDGVLLAVVDGLGHGPDAERAARLALEVLEREPATDPVALIELAHGALRGSRGAAMTVAIARGRTLEVAGVGNVELRATGGVSLSPRPTPGIVGGAIPQRVRAHAAALSGPARVVIVSDGVARRFEWRTLEPLGPEEASELLLAQHSTPRDDATALVADLEPG